MSVRTPEQNIIHEAITERLKQPSRCIKDLDERVRKLEAPEITTSLGSAEFNGSVPDVIGNAKKRGAIDFVAGVVVGDNPYVENDARHWSWMEGWAGAGLAAH